MTCFTVLLRTPRKSLSVAHELYSRTRPVKIYIAIQNAEFRMNNEYLSWSLRHMSFLFLHMTYVKFRFQILTVQIYISI